MVERTAHNGLVVGSNPTKPKINNMDFNLKTYKHHKIKTSFQQFNLLFFLHSPFLNSKISIKMNQKLLKFNLQHYKVSNKLFNNTIKNSVFTHLAVSIHASIVLLHSSQSISSYTQLTKINSLTLLSLRLNNKIYSKKQLKKLKKISYLQNVLILHNSIKTFIKLPFCKLKNNKISK